jgi:hypothetical protein
MRGRNPVAKAGTWLTEIRNPGYCLSRLKIQPSPYSLYPLFSLFLMLEIEGDAKG